MKKKINKLQCKVCKRIVPNEDMFTNNGCVWCSIPKIKKNKISKENLYNKYYIEKKKLKDIKKYFCCGETTIIRLLKKYNIPKRPKSNSCHGQKKKDSAGYILILSPNHPYAQKRGYVPEHRLIMEEKLGRYLKPEEVVHHINNKRDDNRINNLMLFKTKSEHSVYHKQIGNIHE